MCHSSANFLKNPRIPYTDWSHEFAVIAKRKLLGLKITSL